jgi:uncharacterized protein YaiE (UPF0345 family)
MSFKNAEILKQANVYHDGKVTSRTVITADGKRLTLGVMLPGRYRFNTGEPERVEVTAGHCRVRWADADDWQDYPAGKVFSIPGNSHFDIEVTELLDYVCHFG